LKVGDDISTDDILPAGARILPFRSNIPEISKYLFTYIDENFVKRAMKYKDEGSIIVGGKNYGQGSSREHAAIAKRFIGVRVVIAESFSRIHFQNLVNFGIFPLQMNATSIEGIDETDELVFDDIHHQIKSRQKIRVFNNTKKEEYFGTHSLSPRQIELIEHGGSINKIKNERSKQQQ